MLFRSNRACSPWLRAFLLVAFLALLFTCSAGPMLIRQLESVPDSPVRLLPPMWYLSLYQTMQGRATPELSKLTPLAAKGIAFAFALVLLSYGFSYRRRFAAVLETGRRGSGEFGMRGALALLEWFSFRQAGFRRACYRFLIRTLLRNESQRFCLSLSVAFGWLLAVQAAAAGLAEEGSLMAAYLLIAGLRLAFAIPVAIPANWVFRSLPCTERDTVALGRRVILAFLTPLVLLPNLVYFCYLQGFGFGVFHTVYVFVLSMLLIELALLSYNKIPFTCVMPEFRHSLPVRVILLFLGFAIFTHFGGQLEQWMLLNPPRFALGAIGLAGFYYWNHSRLKETDGLSFDSRHAPAVQRLQLLDGD